MASHSRPAAGGPLWDVIHAAFPFHLSLDADLRITSAGASLAKLGTLPAAGAPLSESFTIKSPHIRLEYPAILDAKDSIFILKSRHVQLTLKGQMLELPHEGGSGLCYLCSPVLHTEGDIQDLRLSLSDFPKHDSTVDFIIMLQTQQNILKDANRMADNLRSEISVRKEAQSRLEEINEFLECKVEQRTEELHRTNLQLETWISHLEQRNREMAILNALGEMLQGCQVVGDAFPVVEDAMRSLFPHSAGRFAYFHTADEACKTSSDWGDLGPCPKSPFLPEACPAIRQRKPLSYDGQSVDSCCDLLGAPRQTTYFCKPLQVKGQVVGLLHLRHALEATQAEDSAFAENTRTAQQDIVIAASEHISLALANLRLQECLREQSVRDALTGLYNRRFMSTSFAQEIKRAKRSGSSVGAILLDVDHFKRINDTHGHHMGDLALAELARLLWANIREGDTPCRYGGEEFVVLLPGATKAQTAERAEHLRHAIATTLQVVDGDTTLDSITASLGVAVFPDDGADVAAILNAADAALYASKAGGRNMVSLAKADGA